jgi:phosphopantothenoylcysteine decarboxylase/phosphopantothenate--cysteine ligase
VLVGFAAETGDAASKGGAKLRAKGVDLIVANDVDEPGVGFDHDTNAVWLLGADGSRTEIGLTTKTAVAAAVLDKVCHLLAALAAQ